MRCHVCIVVGELNLRQTKGGGESTSKKKFLREIKCKYGGGSVKDTNMAEYFIDIHSIISYYDLDQ